MKLIYREVESMVYVRIASLRRRKMGNKQDTGSPRGEGVDYEGWEFCELRLEPSLVAYLRDLGSNDVSEGVRIAVRFHQEKARGQA